MQDYSQAFYFCQVLSNGNAENEIFDFRAIHDQRKDIPAIPIRSTLFNAWSRLVELNAQGYGIFCMINATDGHGRDIENVVKVRAQFVDLDNEHAMNNLQIAANWVIRPAMMVQSSTGKAHVYWSVYPYLDADKFTAIQRRLITTFDGDKVIHDLPRVMRLPGFYHCKAQPVLTTVFNLGGGVNYAEAFEQALQNVVVHDTGGGRHPLGTPELAAPDILSLSLALQHTDPNSMSRAEWIAFTCAIKQAGWTLADEQYLFNLWSAWCDRYTGNNPGENLKQWNSIRNTETGWKYAVRKAGIEPLLQFGLKRTVAPVAQENAPAGNVAPNLTPEQMMQQAAAVGVPDGVKTGGEIMDANEQMKYFGGCVLIGRFGEILTPSGRLFNSTQFNASYGGKKFIVDMTGKVTTEAWQAATRGTVWNIPKVDHIRFLPMHPQGAFVTDELGRMGVNTYKPINIRRRAGDASPFLIHLAKLLPVPDDQRKILEYLAHNAKFPGFKIPWAPLIQSNEGAGKNVFKLIMKHVIGSPYVHFPNTKELAESGSKFNAWMRSKLFIIADEIRVDDRRDMIEILKPMISEKEIEIQGKGHDQDKEDNYSNWLFFSNYQDAIPINKNSRRFAIFYSAMQSAEDLINAGMDETYYNRLYGWLETSDGCEIVADYLLNYPIDCGSIPMRAPSTSSTSEALIQSRGPIEQAVIECVDEQLSGFKGGWVCYQSVVKMLDEKKIRHSQKSIQVALLTIGYKPNGKSSRAFFQDDPKQRSILYTKEGTKNPADYGRVQGYE